MSRVAPAQPDQQHAGGVGIEGPGVADPLRPKMRRQRATTSWVVQPGLLVDHHQAVDLVRRRRLIGVSSPSTPTGAASSIRRAAAATAGSGHEARASGCASAGSGAPTAAWTCARRSSRASAASSDSELEVDRGLAQVGRSSTAVTVTSREALVGVGQPLELVGHHLAQDLVDPQRGRRG